MPSEPAAKGGDHPGEGGRRLLEALKVPFGRPVLPAHGGQRGLVHQLCQGQSRVEPMVDLEVACLQNVSDESLEIALLGDTVPIKI